MRRPRLLFYCQHSVGLGHLVRSMHLADGLAGDFDVTLLNGGPWPADLPQPGSLEIVHLPALGLDADYALVSRDERFTVEEAVRLRRSMILEAFRGTAPDVVLIELFPFGRKKFTPELMPLLRGRARRPPGHLRRLQPPRHPGRQPARPAGARRPGRPARERVLRRPARPRGRPLRDPRGDVPSHRPAPHPVHYTGFVRGDPRQRPGRGARGPGPRVGRRRAGRSAAVPGGGRGAPAAARRPRAAHGGRDRPVPPRAPCRRAHPRGGGDAGAGRRPLPAGPRRRDGRVGGVGEPGRLQHDDGHPRRARPRPSSCRTARAARTSRPNGQDGSNGSVPCASSTRTCCRQTRSPTPYATPWTGRRWPSLSTSTDAPGPRSC